MTLSLDENHAQYQIRGYQPGQIQVNDQIYTTSLIVSPFKLITDWKPQSLNELTYEYLVDAVVLEPAILLIGTGEKIEFPSIELYGELINKGIGVEIMDTGAACRTYNALAAEDRNVVAALIIR